MVDTPGTHGDVEKTSLCESPDTPGTHGDVEKTSLRESPDTPGTHGGHTGDTW